MLAFSWLKSAPRIVRPHIRLLLLMCSLLGALALASSYAIDQATTMAMQRAYEAFGHAVDPARIMGVGGLVSTFLNDAVLYTLFSFGSVIMSRRIIRTDKVGDDDAATHLPLCLLLGMSIAFGRMIFYVPGIFVEALTYLAVPAAVSGGLRARAGIRKSIDATRGKRWSILLIMVIIHCVQPLLARTGQACLQWVSSSFEANAMRDPAHDIQVLQLLEIVVEWALLTTLLMLRTPIQATIYQRLEVDTTSASITVFA